jgi:hypothetical protein
MHLIGYQEEAGAMMNNKKQRPERDRSRDDLPPHEDEWWPATVRGRRCRLRHFVGCAAVIGMAT